MRDDVVAALLRSNERLVLIEAPAGCGKTYQGAAYAKDIASAIGHGRLLILAHTHAACGVFAARTKNAGTNVEIKTIAGLIAQIAAAYHQPLGLPATASWVWQDDGRGFEIMADKVAAFLAYQPMVATALARRYPVVICDEHQDSSAAQHRVVMSLHRAGSLLRIFGDPLQRIYRAKSASEERAAVERWNTLKREACCEKLSFPHRWQDGCPELGKWILEARERLEGAQPIDLSRRWPASLQIITADNIVPQPGVYQLSRVQRRPIDELVDNAGQLMILASSDALIGALNAFFGRRISIWEGHKRDALAALVTVMREKVGDAEPLADAMIAFLSETATGFSASSHGNRLRSEVREKCARPTTGKPANLQSIARCILEDASHSGVAAALGCLRNLIDTKTPGFDAIKIDRRFEYRDAIRLGEFACPDDGFAEIARRRSHMRPAPPVRTLSTIHKAKGLECDNVLLMACDTAQFTTTSYARCKMYVALQSCEKITDLSHSVDESLSVV
jgi:DNA helicase-2/ATP-dependent DNA helicase PcrA